MARGPLRTRSRKRPFGAWFASGRVDDEWALQLLETVLAQAGEIQDDFQVVTRLAAIARVHPLDSVRVLAKLVECTSEGYLVEGWVDSARVILKAALATGDRRARDEAEAVVNRLGALGVTEAGDILALCTDTEVRPSDP